MEVIYRFAVKEDMKKILALIKELAIYEKAGNAVTNTTKQLERDGFTEKLFKVIVAEYKQEIIGIALYFPRYSTWKGKCIHLDDIIVTKKYRRKGIGKKLIDLVIKDAKYFGAKLVIWEVLSWNTAAIDFYKKIGAKFDDEWIQCKLYL